MMVLPPRAVLAWVAAAVVVAKVVVAVVVVVQVAAASPVAAVSGGARSRAPGNICVFPVPVTREHTFGRV